MKRHTETEIRVPTMRYHTQDKDKLYVPIPFTFVTERMCQEILAERELILSTADSASVVRQRKLLSQYDPKLSAQAFRDILRTFEIDPKA